MLRSISFVFLSIFSFFFWNSVTAQCTANAGLDTVICVNGVATLGGSPVAEGGVAPYTFSWVADPSLSCTNCSNPTANPTVTTTYTLTIYDADSSCTATDVVTVTVSPNPVASFSASASNLCANLPIQFLNTTPGLNNSFAWNFGNTASGTSNTSTSPNPSHEFISTGSATETFTVSLVVTNQYGCVSAPFTLPVTVKQTPGPNLLDPISDMKNCQGTNFDMLVFDASAVSPASNYQIIWGDGTADYNSTTAPSGISHTYVSQEVFDLQYIVSGTNGCVDTNFMIVTNITNPAIGAANPGNTNGCGPLTICFPLNNFSSNHPTTKYRVDFGDGSPIMTLSHPPPNQICHDYVVSSCGFAGNAFTFRIKAINLCDSSEATIFPIRVSMPPVANFTPNPNPVCVGTSVLMQNQTISGVTVNNCSSFTQYEWNFGDGSPILTGNSLANASPSHVYTSPGTYTISLTASNLSCGISSKTKTICVEAPPVPNFSLNEDTACVSFTAVVTDLSNLANTCNVAYNWTVIFNGSVCSPSSGNWTFANGTNASSTNPQFTFNSNGTYTIRLTLTNKCGSFPISKTIVVQGPPQVSIANLSAICVGNSISPTATVNSCYEPVDTYAWTFPSGTPNISSSLNPGSIQYSTAGTFAVGLSVTNACGTVTDSKNILVKPLPVAVNPTSNAPICAGNTLTLSLTNSTGNSYSWSGPNGFSSTQASPSIINTTTANAGVYSVVVTNNGCSRPAQTVSVTINPFPIVSAGTPFSVCKNASSVTLTGTPVGGTWSGTGVVGSVFNPNTLAPGNYTLSYTYTELATQCTKTATVVATVLAPPTVNAGPDLNLCNQAVPNTLIGSPAGGTWSGTGITNPSGVFTPSTVGDFPITYTYTAANGCTNTDQAIVHVINPTQANAGHDSSVCLNSSTIAFSGLPTGGSWSGTGVTSLGVFTPLTVGTFNLVYTFGSGTCLTRDTLKAIVKPLPVVNAGIDQSICLNANAIQLSVTPSGGTWSGTGVNATGLFDPQLAGVGSKTLTYSYVDLVTQCSNSDTKVITVNPSPNAQAGADLFLCNQPIPENLAGTPSGGTWSGNGITNPTGVFLPSTNGTFEIIYTVTNSFSCLDRDTIQITVGTPQQSSAGNDTSICVDAPNVALTGLPTGGTWTGSGISSNGVFDPTIVGNFPLVYSVGSGTCLSKDTLIAHVLALPIVNAGANFQICLNASPSNLIGAPAGGTWSGIGVSGNTFDPSISGVGTFTLTYSYTNPLTNCSNFNTRQVTVHNIPTVNAGSDLSLCNQAIPTNLTGTPAGGTWSGTGITNPTGQFTPPGVGSFTLTYTFTDVNSCTNQDQTSANVVNATSANAGIDSSVCIDAPNAQLTGLPTGGTWSGSGVSSAGIFDPTSVGDFTLTYTIGSGTCLTSDEMLVHVNPLPIVDAGNDLVRCVDASATLLTGSPAGGNWSGTGVSGNTFDPSIAGVGTFVLTYTYTDPLTGCSNFDTRNVLVNPLPTPNAGNDTTLCNQPVPVQLQATPAGGTWSGTSISSSGLFTPSGVGNFSVDYTFVLPTGCSASDTKIISVVNAALANAGSDLESCFDDANTQLTQNPPGGVWTGIHVTSSGVFQSVQAGVFELVYSYGAGTCLTRDTMEFTVHPLPIVSVGVDQVFCVSEDAVNLVPNPTGGTWAGTGITQTSQGTFDPGIAGVGSHEIIYTYQEPTTSCINQDTLSIVVNPLPNVQFTYNPIACVGTAETFTNTSSLGQNFAWNFGDGNTSFTENPSHTFSAIGIYDVQLIVTTIHGCQDSLEQQIELRDPPHPNFTLTPDSSCAPVLVDFTNTSSGIGLSYAWNFGNGQTSTAVNPTTQTYVQGVLADTTYYIELAVTNFCGTTYHYDSVIAMPKPRSIFGTNLDVGCSPFTVEIANNSLGLPDTYFWDFGDGTTSTDPSALLSHVFTTGLEDTVYTIMLVVTNECGTDTSYHDITVLPNQVNAFFNTNITSGCEDLTVNFTQYSTGANTSSWDFGDGNTSTAFSPTHTFTNAGTFQVYLYVNDGCSFDTATVSVTVFPSPNVDFTFAPDSVCIQEVFQFSNTSQNLSSSTWTFGDGGSSILTSPTHAYASSGTYPVTLTGISATNGCSASVTKNVLVSVQPTANFVATPISGCIPLPVNFTQTGSNVSFQTWNFGDGNSSTNVNPQHTFTQAGTYSVHLYVENSNGCRDSSFQIITAYPLPHAEFTVSATDPCFAPVTLTTSNLSTGATNYQWNFGNGVTSNLTNETLVYNTPGTYTITLTASNIYGCADIYTLPFTVYPTPIAAFTTSKQTVCEGEMVVFSSQSTFADSLVWDFGDGTILTGNPVSYAYDSPGNFPVILTIYGAGGCSDIAILNPGIQVNPTPIAGFSYFNVQNEDPLSGTVEFTNTSQNANLFEWSFGNGNSSNEVNPIERYNQYGNFQVSLIARNQYGCSDTVIQLVHVDFFSGLYVPNAMHPGHPSFEVSHFLPKGVGLKTYEIFIYDDWGNLIWTSNSLDADGRPNEAWDGRFHGEIVKEDAYVWKVNATFLDTKAWRGKEYENGKFKRSGTVTVIR